MRLGSDVVKADLYRELDVPASASADVIQQAYRRQARLSHPDLNPGDKQAEGRMASLNRAREVLLNPALRAAYDRARATQAERSRERASAECGTAAASGSAPDSAERTRPFDTHSFRVQWFDRREHDASGDWVTSARQGSTWTQASPATQCADCGAFQRELRGRHGDQIVQFGARLHAWSAPHQRLLAGLLLAAGLSMILSLRPVTLGIGPEHAKQPVTVSVQALLP